MAVVALLDANVLWPAALRDILLHLALQRMFHPIWSEQILAEMVRTLAERRGLRRSAIERTAALMRQYFPRATVSGYEHRIRVMQNNPGDRHVLAAAVEARSNIIVTSNVRHFPAQICEPFGIEVVTPDEFLCRLWETDRDAVVRGLRTQSAELHHPPLMAREILQGLQRTVPELAARVLAAGVVD